jgi:uncharacterized LabA/DUF88 family protein
MEYIYVDNSNLFIEARRVSAVAKGFARNIVEAMNGNILDNTYTIDFGKLHQFVAGADRAKIARAALFGSRPPPNDSIWTFAKKAGFEVILTDRNIKNKEKRVDTGITTAMIRDSYKHANVKNDVITLVAGDGDFVPAIEALTADDYRVDLVFWDHASEELKKAASKFVSLNNHLDYLVL